METDWTKDNEPEWWESHTILKQVGCGKVYATICVKDSKVDHCILHGSTKNVLCLAPNESLADMTTFAIRHVRHKSEYSSICKNLIGQRCSKYIPNELHNQSCPDILGKILNKELNCEM